MQTLIVRNLCWKLGKWSMQTGAPHRWHLNLVLFRFDGGQVLQSCLPPTVHCTLAVDEINPGNFVCLIAPREADSERKRTFVPKAWSFWEPDIFDTTVGSKCFAVDVVCIECTHSHRMHSIAHENVRGHFASVHHHKWKLWASVVHLYLWQRQRNLKGPEAGRSKIPLKKKYKVHVQNEMLWTFVTSAHTTGCRPFLSNQKQFISSDVAGVLDSPACVSVKTTNWAVVLRAKLVYVDSACTRVIYSLAGFGQTCWHGLLEHSGVTRRLSHLRGATGQHSEKR